MTQVASEPVEQIRLIASALLAGYSDDDDWMTPARFQHFFEDITIKDYFVSFEFDDLHGTFGISRHFYNSRQNQRVCKQAYKVSANELTLISLVSHSSTYLLIRAK